MKIAGVMACIIFANLSFGMTRSNTISFGGFANNLNRSDDCRGEHCKMHKNPESSSETSPRKSKIKFFTNASESLLFVSEKVGNSQLNLRLFSGDDSRSALQLCKKIAKRPSVKIDILSSNYGFALKFLPQPPECHLIFQEIIDLFNEIYSGINFNPFFQDYFRGRLMKQKYGLLNWALSCLVSKPEKYRNKFERFLEEFKPTRQSLENNRNINLIRLQEKEEGKSKIFEKTSDFLMMDRYQQECILPFETKIREFLRIQEPLVTPIIFNGDRGKLFVFGTRHFFSQKATLQLLLERATIYFFQTHSLFQSFMLNTELIRRVILLLLQQERDGNNSVVSEMVFPRLIVSNYGAKFSGNT